jgi:hypothetical protein
LLFQFRHTHTESIARGVPATEGRQQHVEKAFTDKDWEETTQTEEKGEREMSGLNI